MDVGRLLLHPSRRRDRPHRSTRSTRRDPGTSHPTGLVDLRRLVLHPRPDRRPARPHRDGAADGLGGRRARAGRRLPRPSAIARPSRPRRSRGASRGRIVRPDPVRACRARSSPDAILGAIVDELAAATGADHIVVARRRPDARVLEATLVSARPGVPDSTTRLPIGDLDDPLGAMPWPSREPVAVPVVAGVAEPRPGRRPARPAGWLDRPRLRPRRRSPARPGRWPAPPGCRANASSSPTGSPRGRAVYGLANTLAAPLTADERIVGAIVLSHRTARSWPERPGGCWTARPGGVRRRCRGRTRTAPRRPRPPPTP